MQILDTNPQLFFHLQQQRLIELIRNGKVEEALEFAQEELAPRGEENVMFGLVCYHITLTLKINLHWSYISHCMLEIIFSQPFFVVSFLDMLMFSLWSGMVLWLCDLGSSFGISASLFR